MLQLLSRNISVYLQTSQYKHAQGALKGLTATNFFFFNYDYVRVQVLYSVHCTGTLKFSLALSETVMSWTLHCPGQCSVWLRAFCTALTIIQYKKYHILALTIMHSGYTVMKSKIVQYFYGGYLKTPLQYCKVDSALSRTVLCWTQRVLRRALSLVECCWVKEKFKKLKKTFWFGIVNKDTVVFTNKRSQAEVSTVYFSPSSV